MTRRVYFEDSYCFVDSAVVTDMEHKGDGTIELRLDRTVFHPQGGGQPSDRGTLAGRDVVRLTVDHQRGEVVHSVEEPLDVKVGDKVELSVDEKTRRLHARLHSAGHLLDIVVKKLALPLVPGKGYHHPKGAYVEFTGHIPSEQREKTLRQIQIELDILLKCVPAENSSQVHVDDSGVRTVMLFKEDDGTLCGGTHVKHISEIGACTVTKFTKKQKNIRLCYIVD
eukprot:Plantae.Rhodophyta-Purpureofilum_apyrenoidigerum.ctg12495.p1 GENE.Plantae.Rhodophyta-Purpureofilum_apyrenoidigerum.ctg12495~~Plantae.Rhodophyta-Purpureofilum_apyrenoidigerum.ctg12495.p1  ORF type:complete len:225 (+),score=38.63 Plantae.Rhodophyta-Purpureofilum_apyrenoidigerum.ctg12495:273-947(+)